MSGFAWIGVVAVFVAGYVVSIYTWPYISTRFRGMTG